MEVTYGSATSAGSVRTNNEDRMHFVCPEDDEERLRRGVLAVLADGAGCEVDDHARVGHVVAGGAHGAAHTLACLLDSEIRQAERKPKAKGEQVGLF